MVDIAEQICLAVDQIVNERLKSINYDTTIVATIVDDRNAKDYKYICSNGSSQFVAFSKDTSFKKGDSVQVTIPNNDYDKQKVIRKATRRYGNERFLALYERQLFKESKRNPLFQKAQ